MVNFVHSIKQFLVFRLLAFHAFFKIFGHNKSTFLHYLITEDEQTFNLEQTKIGLQFAKTVFRTAKM